MKPLDIQKGIPADRIWIDPVCCSPTSYGKTTFVFQMIQAGHIPMFIDAEGQLDHELVRSILPEWEKGSS